VLTLINSNRMLPPIGPVGLDYVATAARAHGIETRVIDLGLAVDPEAELRAGFARDESRLVGISFRNVDDSFWPSATWFVPHLVALVTQVRRLSDAPIVLGGVGASLFPRQLLELSGADFVVRGDGERATPALYRCVTDGAPLGAVPGLLFRENGKIVANHPAWDEHLVVPSARDAIDNAAYFRRGGQAGIETARGCPRACIYCADPVAKGRRIRKRNPAEVASEFAALVDQGATVVHLCDGELNLDRCHALGVCAELVRRRLRGRVAWYAYAATTPFDDELALAMRASGCVGINFGADSASDGVLASYRQAHRRRDLAETVRLCRKHGIRCMIDLLIGGPGETPETVAETIHALREMAPDCVGAAVGMRIYPDTEAAALASRSGAGKGETADPPGIRRRYAGPIDLLQPTFYVSPALGDRPARIVRDLLAGDDRFFPPADEESDGRGAGTDRTDHNYSANRALEEAIARGERGAYWDILRRLRHPAEAV
jgi:hypothetical protein